MAQIRISELPEATSGIGFLALVQDGVTKKVDSQNLIDAIAYPEGSYNLNTVGYGYTTSNSGQLYIFPKLYRPLPIGKTINITKLTATIRCAGKLIASNLDITANIASAAVSSGSGTFHIQLTGLTNNWVANEPVSVVFTIAFTIA